MRQPGPYQVQAAISALHAQAKHPEDTDWPQIAALYDALMRMTPSPIIELNRAVAIAMADGPLKGLALLDQTDLSQELVTITVSRCSRGFIATSRKHAQSAGCLHAGAKAMPEHERASFSELPAGGSCAIPGIG